MKNKANEWTTNGTIRSRYFSLVGFITIFTIFILMGSAPLYVLAKMYHFSISGLFFYCYLGYYLIVTAIFSVLIAYRRFHDLTKPLTDLSEAASDVANGDFSVYLPPIHQINNYDYMDFLFENFNQMVEELGSIETLKNDFIGNVSHEFKLPLSIIQSYAVNLRDENLSLEERQESITVITSETQKLANLVTNILRLIKLENQSMTYHKEKYDIARQLAECAISFESQWSAKDIVFLVELPDECSINADKELLDIVWHNLLANAIKFTPKQGTISLKLEVIEGGFQIAIVDSGIGMNPDTTEHIFDQFYQGDSSHLTTGNGLGLAMVKKIIDISEGKINVVSTVGKGSQFLVWLPKNIETHDQEV